MLFFTPAPDRFRLGIEIKSGIHGTATAASIWNTEAIGAPVAFDRFEIAILLSVINYATIRFLTLLKQRSLRA